MSMHDNNMFDFTTLWLFFELILNEQRIYSDENNYISGISNTNLLLLSYLFFSFNPDPTTRNSFWTLAIGGAFTAMPVWTVCQPAVQRFQAARSLKESKK